MRQRFLIVLCLAAFCACHPVKSFVGTYSLVPENRAVERTIDHIPLDGNQTEIANRHQQSEADLKY